MGTDGSEPDRPDVIGAARREAGAKGVSPFAGTGPGEVPGDLIDRYRLVEAIGEGGMGTVWRARQSQPVKRDVALKVIKLGMDTREVVARFEAERQALALMDHAHIAKVLDGGATDAGRPFFVMELVEGRPITEHCDERRLGLRERLILFGKVCDALHHAHQKGIIHRDIKPSNVLVAQQGDEAIPKVIDFGIAKATGAELAQTTAYTRDAQILGTPEYMAPEQLGGSAIDIDTRADVYSLGVLLYELLTGTRPFDLETTLALGYAEFLRTIREEDPPRPSTRVSTAHDKGTAAEPQPDAKTEILSKRLRGDLDWIVMKALEKDRARRYESASAFAADVARYLAEEPVVAAPPSSLYRWRKFVRRRKKTVLAMSTIVLLFVSGSVGTGIGWWKTMQANAALDVALREKTRAFAEEERQRKLAQENERRARAAEAAATERSEELAQVATFQAEQFRDLDVSQMGVRMRQALLRESPEAGRGDLSRRVAGLNFTNLALSVLRANIFDRAIATIDSQFADQPLLQARLLQEIATTLRQLGLLDLALDPQERAVTIRRTTLGGDHPDTLSSIKSKGLLLRDRGDFAASERVLRGILDRSRRLYGEDHLETIEAMAALGTALSDALRTSESMPYTKQALEGRRRLLGEEHPATLESLNNVGVAYLNLGQHEEAAAYLRDSYELSCRVYGPDHRESLDTLVNLGQLLRSQGKLVEAESLSREALEGCRRAFGDEHPTTVVALEHLAHALFEQGKLAAAEAARRESVELARLVLGDEHERTLRAMNNLTAVLRQQNKIEEAEVVFAHMLEVKERHPARHLESLPKDRIKMGVLLLDQDKLPQAAACFRRGLDDHRRVFGEDHPDTRNAAGWLEEALQKLASAAREARDDVQLGEALAGLGELQLSRHQHDAAVESLAQAVGILGEVLPEEDPRRWWVQSALGAAIAGQGALEEAETVLLESVERLLEHSGTWDPGDATDGAIQRLIGVYEELHSRAPQAGYDTAARTWSAKRRAARAAGPGD